MPACRKSLLGFIQQEASILETNWYLKNEESVPLWNQVLDKKKVSGADIKVFGYSLIPDSRYARTHYCEELICASQQVITFSIKNITRYQEARPSPGKQPFFKFPTVRSRITEPTQNDLGWKGSQRSSCSKSPFHGQGHLPQDQEEEFKYNLPPVLCFISTTQLCSWAKSTGKHQTRRPNMVKQSSEFSSYICSRN